MSDLVIVGVLSVVTLLFRALPLLVKGEHLVNGEHLLANEHTTELGAAAPPAASDMSLLPLAVLAALIVPGGITVEDGNPAVGAAALSVGVLLVLSRRVPILVIIMASVLTATAVHLATR
jgi:hypothetical protein